MSASWVKRRARSPTLPGRASFMYDASWRCAGRERSCSEDERRRFLVEKVVLCGRNDCAAGEESMKATAITRRKPSSRPERRESARGPQNRRFFQRPQERGSPASTASMVFLLPSQIVRRGAPR
jgi:hypothetical protein